MGAGWGGASGPGGGEEGGAGRRHGWVLLILLCLALFLPGFATIPPFDDDEARYAQATRQMLETGDLIDIRFQDDPRYQKPVGIYWLQAALVTLVGQADQPSIWAYRLASLAGAVAAVLLTAWAGAALFGRRAATVAASLLAATLLLGVEARMAKTDAVLLATVVAAMGALARAWLLEPGRRLPWPLTFVFWIALGLGVLVKGPAIVLVVGGAVLMLSILDRDIGWWGRLRPMAGAPLAFIVVLPWLAAIGHLSDGRFFGLSLGEDVLGKVIDAQQSHVGPPGYYLATFWFAAFPATLLVLPAIPAVWRRRREPAVRFCLAWLLPAWLVFEFSATKLPHYTLPVFPAILLLAAAVFTSGEWRQAGRGWRVAAMAIWGICAVAGAVVLTGYRPVLEGRFDPWLLLGGLALAATAAATLLAFRQGRGGRMLGGVLVAALLVSAAAEGRLLPATRSMWLSQAIADALPALRHCPDSRLVSLGYRAPSLVFLVGTDTLRAQPEQAAEVAVNDSCALILVEDRREDVFREALAPLGGAVVEVTTFRGFDYSRGRWRQLTLYRPSVQHPAVAAGAPT